VTFPKDYNKYSRTSFISKNKTIIEYMIVEVCEYKFKIISTFSTVYSVIELPNHEKIELLEDIDEKLIFNNYDSDEGDY